MFSIAILDCPGLYPGSSTAHEDGRNHEIVPLLLGTPQDLPNEWMLSTFSLA